MNLTESHAGSDVGALRTKAVKQDDGSYRIFGTKIFITWGDHDIAGNVIHMVLARTEDAPPGTRGRLQDRVAGAQAGHPCVSDMCHLFR
jgi:acyl-CoA dehydrogenase